MTTLAAWAPLLSRLRAFARDRRGATAIEYCLIAAGIAGAIIASVSSLGVTVTDMWTSIGALF